MTVVTVGFRNAWTADGLNPFPVGLNDCAAALDWVHEHRDDLGITKIVLQGESGGGNLVLATALKAKREDRLDRIDGVYAMVPYISGGYGWDNDRKLRWPYFATGTDVEGLPRTDAYMPMPSLPVGVPHGISRC
jgi:acetyl esterase